MAPRVRAFRWAVLVLALLYFVDVARSADYAAFGAQFRYLTIWALTGNLAAAAAMLVPRWGRADGRLDIALSVLAVIDALVVFSYWRLFLVDPSLVNGETAPKPYREYYLHLVGPVLMWADFLVLKRGFRRFLPVLPWLAGAVAAYVLWAELLVGPLNAKPVGSVTSGLPYPFLNDMGPAARVRFYLTIYATGVVFAALFFGIGRYASSRSSAASPER